MNTKTDEIAKDLTKEMKKIFISDSKITDIQFYLHYIIKLGEEYSHHTIICNSISDMKLKAKMLEERLGKLNVNIRINKKKKLYIANVTSKDPVYKDSENVYINENDTTGILFNPPLSEQIISYKESLEKFKSIDTLLYDDDVEMFLDDMEDNKNIKKDKTSGDVE